MKDLLVDNRYRIGHRVAQGGFSLVYTGLDIATNENVAIKLTHRPDDYRDVYDEAEICRALSGGIGIPKVRWVGPGGEYYMIVTDLLGPSLEDLLAYCDNSFSLKTVLLIAVQAISRIEFVHNRGYLHRDVKPGNFLLGTGKQGNTLYVVDFGMTKSISLAEHDEGGTCAFRGTRQFASLRSHRGHEQSRADDLESLGYSLVFLLNGSLPWQHLDVGPAKERQENIMAMKESTSVESLCEGLPREFATYIEYTRSLGFYDKPDYAYLRTLFRRLFLSRAYKHDNIFDWTIKRFKELGGYVEDGKVVKGKNKEE